MLLHWPEPTKQNGRIFFSCGSFDVLVVSSGIASIRELKEQMGKYILLCREEFCIPGQEVWET